MQQLRILFCLCVIAAVPVSAQTAPLSSIPHLEKRGNVTQLIVDGKPFLALAGELSNNAATNLEYMKPIWPKLAAAHLNTVLTAISWAMFERSEGKFDYTLIDGLIQDARQQHLRLVLLWFGSWKNTSSSYAPDWVKKDFQRFPRLQLLDGSGIPPLLAGSSRRQPAPTASTCARLLRLACCRT